MKTSEVPKSEMIKLDVVARWWSSAEAISCKVGDCFAPIGLAKTWQQLEFRYSQNLLSGFQR
jgi:hypothetical protein